MNMWQNIVIYWAKYPLSVKYWPKLKILISVLPANMMVQIYWYQQKYWLGEYIGISIGWTNISLTLPLIMDTHFHAMHTNQP
jgi:hypothetical protein